MGMIRDFTPNQDTLSAISGNMTPTVDVDDTAYNSPVKNKHNKSNNKTRNKALNEYLSIDLTDDSV